MGKHRAPRKPDVPMRLAVVSTAALLTALVTADRGASHSNGPTAGRAHNTTVGDPTGPVSAPPDSGPEAVPDLPLDEHPLGDIAPTPEPELGRHAADNPNRQGAPQPADDPGPPPPRDVLSGATAAWIAGTTQGYEWLTHIEQCIVSHIMPNADPRSV
ncbi:hypothetical protein AB0M22_30640 [Nocardia sp. NPDC051756]|uniref:hypothetical protein n=1 Tax=Nocardia sp. NPDC051756 TaxID=3154751 RepID=UPI00343D1B7C